MSDTPLISIVILTYNNFPMLRQSIQSALGLDYPNREIIIVDNASTDDTAALIQAEFGDQVELVVREKNSPTAARNSGFWRARGELVLSIDNDMIFEDRQILHRAVSWFRALPTVGVVGAKICGRANPNQPLKEHWWYATPMEDGKDRHFFTSYFPEGAVFFRSEALKQTGGYDEHFHSYIENIDLSLRFFRRGWKILYCPSISSVEMVVSKDVSNRRTEWNYYAVRNRLWYAWKHLSPRRFMTYTFLRIAVSAIKSIRYGWFDYFLAGLRDGLLPPQFIRDARDPLKPAEWAEIKNMEGVSASVPFNEEGEEKVTLLPARAG